MLYDILNSFSLIAGRCAGHASEKRVKPEPILNWTQVPHKPCH